MRVQCVYRLKIQNVLIEYQYCVCLQIYNETLFVCYMYCYICVDTKYTFTQLPLLFSYKIPKQYTY